MRQLLMALAAVGCWLMTQGAVGQAETIEPFNGTSLQGWSGDFSYWRVEDGCIVGASTVEHPLTASTYLVWDGDMPQDFELRCQVRLQGGNSGIHYRSTRIAGQHDLYGFQADLDANNSYSGVLYEGLGRELMSARGEQVEFTPEGKRVIAQFAPDAVLRRAIHTGDWNNYRIEANGTRVRHWINDVLMSDVTDGDASRFRRDGLLAFQLHQGDPMEVRYRSIKVSAIRSAPSVSNLTLPEGFTAELLASAQPSQGSWVALTFDQFGRALISPQDGPLSIASIPGVSRTRDGTLFAGSTTEVSSFDSALRSAQGLCFLGDVLYANGIGADGTPALWRFRDLDHNGSYEDSTALIQYSGDTGEHGPHAVEKGPDGALYVALGNHTRLPETIVRYSTDETPGRAPTSPHDFFGEDRVDARMWDPRGHAIGVYSPGGVVVRVDPVTEAATIFAGGFRNAYDHCFDARGELFTYDSDMEWDIGAPWYRAPRFVHVVQGGEYGWRSGSAAWPQWYPDSLPAACDTDSASPTGMVAGWAGAFPAPWNKMIFCADWTYGRILAMTLVEEGASFAATWQPFISGRPMPVADIAWGPDGAMYFVTGGRATQSGLYRVRAAETTGNPPRVEHSSDAAATLRHIRKSYEQLQHPLSPDELVMHLPTIVRGLDLSDRFIRTAARVALEHQPLDRWRGAITECKTVRQRLAFSLALVRAGVVSDALLACHEAASALQSPCSDDDAVTALRIVEVAVARHRELASDPSVRQSAALGLTLADPNSTRGTPLRWIALELASALALPSVVPLAVEALEHSEDRSEALRYATLLRLCPEGWTDALRIRYWQWLFAANDRAGGLSLRGFIEQLRSDASARVGPPTTAARDASGTLSLPPSLERSPTTSSAFHAWTVAEFESEFDSAAVGGSDARPSPSELERGARIFRESSCILCHRVHGDGATTGPDLSGVAGRFSRRDLLTAILDPSATISDQYRESLLEMHDGSLVVGRIVRENAVSLDVRTNPLTDEREVVPVDGIASRSQLTTSSMPKGLLDSRSREDILALMAYLESRPITPR